MDDELQKAIDSINNRYSNSLKSLVDDEQLIFDQTEPIVDSPKYIMPKENIKEANHKEEPKTYWNYRVIRKKIHRGEVTYCIHEVYYENDIPLATTTDSVAIYDDSVEDIKKTLQLYLKATEKPVLNFEDIAKFGDPK